MCYLVPWVEQFSHELIAFLALTDDDPFVRGLLFIDRLGQVSEISLHLQTAGDVFDTLAWLNQYIVTKCLKYSQLTEYSLERGIIDGAFGLYEMADSTFQCNHAQLIQQADIALLVEQACVAGVCTRQPLVIFPHIAIALTVSKLSAANTFQLCIRSALYLQSTRLPTIDSPCQIQVVGCHTRT